MPRPTKTAAPASGSKKRRMPGEQRFYAVRTGVKPGVYTNWADCQRQISGYKGAVFKSFPTAQDAALFVAGKDPSPKYADQPEKFYGVAVGRKPGVYTDWAEAQKAFVGSKGPKYKKFATRAEAEEFVRTFGGAATTRQEEEEEDDSDEDEDDDEDEEEDEAPPAKRSRTSGPATVKADAILLKIWTDGSSLGNGRAGSRAGLGVFFGHGDLRNISERLVGDPQTNQRAELAAILRALEVAGDSQGVKIHSDSKYSIQCVTEWYATWEKNGWLTREGPVKNVDLVQAIRKRINARDKKGTKTVFEWVKGHASDPGNIAADQLAVQGAKS
ncbi:hypothetical protein GQ53DRAFT_847147 [Thozetella sp. PMI_491]|nr:hypothetical protein GQ53DRAFT_847147 [Thozetella sp. PMI_491]